MPQQPTYKQKLDNGESYWMWKLGLRIFLVITGIIGIGCFGWAFSSSNTNDDVPYYLELDDRWSTVWTLITVSL